MKEIQVRLPEAVADKAEQAVRDGLFASVDDLVRLAILQLVNTEHLRAIEDAQLEDIQSAIKAAS